MNSTDIHLHLVTDTPGSNLGAAREAAAQAMPGALIIEHTYPPARSPELLADILKQVEKQPGIVLYDLADPSMVRELLDVCNTIGCHALAKPKQSDDAERTMSEPQFSSLMRLRVKEQPRTLFRLVLSVFAIALALIAFWLAAPGPIGQAVAFPPTEAVAASAGDIGAAHWRARIGLVRGDLWADYATLLTQASLGGFAPPTATPSEAIAAGRTAAKRAAELAPQDSSIWLLLAVLDAQMTEHRDRVASELKMSYFTGPNDATLRALRINVAFASNAIADADLQTLVGLELRAIISDEPTLKPSIVTAYQHATADGQHFLDTQVGSLDPTLLAAMHQPVKTN